MHTPENTSFTTSHVLVNVMQNVSLNTLNSRSDRPCVLHVIRFKSNLKIDMKDEVVPLKALKKALR